MKIGRLKKKICIQKGTETPNSFGEPVTVWNEFKPLRWAEVDPRAGSERFIGRQNISEESVIFKLRFTEGIVPKMRVLYGDFKYDIQSVVNVNEQNRELLIACNRVTT